MGRTLRVKRFKASKSDVCHDGLTDKRADGRRSVICSDNLGPCVLSTFWQMSAAGDEHERTRNAGERGDGKLLSSSSTADASPPASRRLAASLPPFDPVPLGATSPPPQLTHPPLLTHTHTHPSPPSSASRAFLRHLTPQCPPPPTVPLLTRASLGFRPIISAAAARICIFALCALHGGLGCV